MIKPKNLEELAGLIEKGRHVLFFTADWCGDCVFIKPYLPAIMEEFPELPFVEVDRDDYLIVCEKMNVFGIPSFIVVEEGKELGRFVSKKRKTKDEIVEFLKQYSN